MKNLTSNWRTKRLTFLWSTVLSSVSFPTIALPLQAPTLSKVISCKSLRHLNFFFLGGTPYRSRSGRSHKWVCLAYLWLQGFSKLNNPKKSFNLNRLLHVQHRPFHFAKYNAGNIHLVICAVFLIRYCLGCRN